MKKQIYILLGFQLIMYTQLYTQETANAEIAYIGNEGFMITNNDKKVFIDALYYYGNTSMVMDYDELTRQMIMNNIEPFSNGQLFLVTHNHIDHFSASKVSSYLSNNYQAKLVGPSTVTKAINNSALENQLVSVDPAQYEFIDTTINGIQLTAYYLVHQLQNRVYNVGYFVNIEGLKIFHMGDNAFEDSTEYLTFNFNEKDIDVLFLFNFTNLWGTQKQRDFIKKYINPRFIVLMHNPPPQLSSIKEQVKELDDSFPPIIVFSGSMEKAEINDSITITNHMPEILANINDTTVMINTPINITVPSLFSDPDANDSLTYFISGLPDGLVFDSINMIISGSAQSEGTFRIKVNVKDKSFSINNISFKIIVENPVKISEQNLNNTFIYPNPADEVIFFKNVGFTDALVQIYDLQGKLVLKKKYNDNSLNISNLPKGLYTINIIGSDDVFTRRLIKE